MPQRAWRATLNAKIILKIGFAKLFYFFFRKKFLILEAFLFLSFAFIATFGPMFWAIFADSLIIVDFLKKQMPFERYRKAFLKN